MTKSAKHKKEFRREKNKIKLKLTAKLEKSVRNNKKGSLLPKGLNVTDTSFKTKKIILPENLRPEENSGIPLNSRRQTYKELLGHMGHFSSSIQQDGINGMKELLVKFPGVLEINMGSLLGKLSELMSARDVAVRKCSLKLMEHIIQSTTPEKILPFFPLLNAQLMCCMNHIALDIQKDSHLLLDILLTHVPGLVATATMQILPNFLEQISCRDDSKAGKRVLTINPNQRLTSLKWRQEVLTRINRLLVLLLNKNHSESRDSNCVTFSDGVPCALYMTRNFKVDLNFQKPGHFAVNEKTSPNHRLIEFSSHLFPLLMETWIEALASEQLNKNQGSSLIGVESVALLTSITNVLFTLWSIMNQSEDRKDLLSWFEKQCGEPLIRNFIQRFPFSARVETVRSKKQPGDSHCREQNLILCFLWAQLETRGAAKYSEPVFQYLCGLFQSADQHVLTQIELEQLKEILLTCCSKTSLHGHVDGVVEAAVEFTNRVRSDRKDRLLVNKMLMKIGQVAGDRNNIPSLKQWIETCPAVIRDNTNMELLESINRVMSRNSNCLANGKKEVVSLVDNLERLGSKCDHWKAVFDFIYLTMKDEPNQDKIIVVLQQQINKLENHEIKSYGLGVLSIVGAKT